MGLHCMYAPHFKSVFIIIRIVSVYGKTGKERSKIFICLHHVVDVISLWREGLFIHSGRF